MKTILEKIANILMLNATDVYNLGILEGRMGIAIFFYKYARFSQDNIYSEVADELLDSVIEEVNNIPDLSFDQGAIGIAWGIRYLIRHDFIEGNPEEVLLDIENLFFNRYRNDLISKIPVSAIGLYLHSMLQDVTDANKYEQYIECALRKYDFYFLSLPNIPKSINYINSALLFLSTLEKYDKYKAWVDRIIFKIVLYISDMESFNRFDAYELTTLYKILTSLHSSSVEKRLIINRLEPVCNIIGTDIPIDYLWQNFLFFPEEVIPPNLEEINIHLDRNYSSTYNLKSLSLYKGLAGIGLALMNIVV
jgi:hypothetical protein